MATMGSWWIALAATRRLSVHVHGRRFIAHSVPVRAS
jgi:hypothetical protein